MAGSGGRDSERRKESDREETSRAEGPNEKFGSSATSPRIRELCITIGDLALCHSELAKNPEKIQDRDPFAASGPTVLTRFFGLLRVTE